MSLCHSLLCGVPAAFCLSAPALNHWRGRCPETRQHQEDEAVARAWPFPKRKRALSQILREKDERSGERRGRTGGRQGDVATGACPASLLPLPGPGDGGGPLRENESVPRASVLCCHLVAQWPQRPQGEIRLGN
ncbi:unnamed protein product [Rangifer tarandus platyrhynchus]|uniref:Uncharacterized protein n=1 Tax=Rangifer tarandus platyrhynchus TaxID=3082113 RepID=A0AC59ZZ74_RANTA